MPEKAEPMPMAKPMEKPMPKPMAKPMPKPAAKPLPAAPKSDPSSAYYPARQGTEQSNRLGDLFGVPAPN